MALTYYFDWFFNTVFKQLKGNGPLLLINKIFTCKVEGDMEFTNPFFRNRSTELNSNSSQFTVRHLRIPIWHNFYPNCDTPKSLQDVKFDQSNFFFSMFVFEVSIILSNQLLTFTIYYLKFLFEKFKYY